jgi:hypothetical protein
VSLIKNIPPFCCPFSTNYFSFFEHTSLNTFNRHFMPIPPNGTAFSATVYLNKPKMARSNNRNRRQHYNRQYSGHPNHPNYGQAVSENSPHLQRNYGYNQAPNSSSNIGGQAYGHNYGQYYQGSFNRDRSNPEEYAGEFYPGHDDEGYDYNQWEDRPMRFGREEIHGPYMRGYPPLHNDIEYGPGTNAYGHRHDRYNDSIYSNDYLEDDDYDYDIEHEYQHSGYQTYGNNEGFGLGDGRRNEGGWEYEDDYREGHAPHHVGYGKYGSR